MCLIQPVIDEAASRLMVSFPGMANLVIPLSKDEFGAVYSKELCLPGSLCGTVYVSFIFVYM